jgi:8-oxo-dGTP diphosphatase
VVLLGIGQAVRQRILVPRSGVRIPHPQPNAALIRKTHMPMHNIGVSTKAIIFHENKFLVLLRGKTAPSNPLKWDLPGGDVDFGEDPHDSIVREIREETGLRILDLEVFDAEAHINSQEEHWFTLAYKAQSEEETVKISWEHDEYRWVDKKEYLKLPNIPKIVKFVEKAG